MLDEITAIRQGLTLSDRDILGDALQPIDRDEPWLDNYYTWYYALGAYFKPKRIGELGVRFGYSLKSLILGSQSAGQVVDMVYGWDAEQYTSGSMEVATETLKRCEVPFQLHTVDLRKLAHLITDGGLDLIHVDADHSSDGTYQDLCLARAALAPGGVLLADDYDADHRTRVGILRYCMTTGAKRYYIPHYRGLAVIVPPASDE